MVDQFAINPVILGQIIGAPMIKVNPNPELEK
jgi:hypothetical protein